MLEQLLHPVLRSPHLHDRYIFRRLIRERQCLLRLPRLFSSRTPPNHCGDGLKVLFFGTDSFSAKTLEALYREQRYCKKTFHKLSHMKITCNSVILHMLCCIPLHSWWEQSPCSLIFGGEQGAALQIFWRAKGGEFLLPQCRFAPPPKHLL